ncbi:glutathione S-transferase family protein [Tsuneonella mangrovi]|uniref:glutathione S-transferase family protein n=1 Tax=Tsuneonella mangrovi TaxID=1982042 RepID=UPI000BA20676|nr:glutathione S-transferase family protein [Tsuneonella mangrovi]
MTTLRAYHLPGRWGLVTTSPFCLKLDAFMRMTGIEHESITATTPFAGPKKKAPWIEHKGMTLGDSAFIIDYLKAEFGTDPDAELTPEQRGKATAIQRLVEENLYWALVYDRWRRDENWPILKNSVLGDIPAPVRAIIAPYARRAVRKQLAGHGMGLHSPEEIAEIASKDISALAGLLGENDWFFGNAPGLTDATVYSLLANIAFVPFSSPMKSMIAEHSNLTAFLDRFRSRFYPEWEA